MHQTALHLAARQDSLPMIELLLDAGNSHRTQTSLQTLHACKKIKKIKIDCCKLECSHSNANKIKAQMCLRILCELGLKLPSIAPAKKGEVIWMKSSETAYRAFVFSGEESLSCLLPSPQHCHWCNSSNRPRLFMTELRDDSRKDPGSSPVIW